jgi:eukaryotic-like serine/threonine-protein kinase
LDSGTTILGKYEVLQQLGSGAMGVVYRARDQVLDREVALKVMRAESQAFPEMSERFNREARACAKLHHQNIVTIYDFGEADSSAYIVMELLEGVDWRTAMKAKAPLPLSLKLDLITQVCDGLAHAHQSGIVHRDLKPSNFFVHLQRQAKILDFGLVKLSTSVLTRTGMVLGTPNYMAPEQITGQKCDSRSDLFSAAVVFFELLTGTHPFQAPFVPKRIATGVPDLLCEVDPRMPPVLQDILSKALQRDPDERFQTGQELADALRIAVAGGGFEQAEIGQVGNPGRDDSDDTEGSDSQTQTIATLYRPGVTGFGTEPDTK